MPNATRMLLVDDDPAIRQIYSEILESAGYKVWQASTGREGLELTREVRPSMLANFANCARIVTIFPPMTSCVRISIAGRPWRALMPK